MKKRTTILISVISVISIMLSLVSCNSTKEKGNAYTNYSAPEEQSFDTSIQYEDSIELLDKESSTSGAVSQVQVPKDNRKIIEKIYLNVQTKQFDSLISLVEDKIAALGGYVESSEATGNAYDKNISRRASLAIRIPSGSSGDFVSFMEENGNVITKEITTEDVTLSYVDTESRIAALETEKEALEVLLSKAETMADIITVRDRLSDVIYELDSYKSTIRTWDNLIEYTTISISIVEVEKETIVEKQTVWQKIGTDLSENLSDIGSFFVDMFVCIISSLPYIGMATVPTIIIVIIIVKKVKKAKKKALEEKSDE